MRLLTPTHVHSLVQMQAPDQTGLRPQHIHCVGDLLTMWFY